MQTPMTHQQDVFTVEIHVLANSEINYGFLITTDGEGDSTQTIWDGDHYSTIIATLSRTLEIDSPVVLPEESPAKE